MLNSQFLMIDFKRLAGTNQLRNEDCCDWVACWIRANTEQRKKYTPESIYSLNEMGEINLFKKIGVGNICLSKIPALLENHPVNILLTMGVAGSTKKYYHTFTLYLEGGKIWCIDSYLEERVCSVWPFPFDKLLNLAENPTVAKWIDLFQIRKKNHKEGESKLNILVRW